MNTPRTDASLRGGLGKTKRLVVVADNSLIVEVIRIGLRQSGGFEILGRARGRRGSASSIMDAGPDVVLIDDLENPEEAISLIREIRTDGTPVVIIVLTMTMDHDWLHRAFDAGASGAISKLIHPLALGTLVRESVNGNVVHLFSRPRPEATGAPDCPLTPRELEVLRLMAGGSTNGGIARELWVTEQTVKFHLSNLYRKLGVSNRTEASHYAHVNGLVGWEGGALKSAGQPSLAESGATRDWVA